MIAPEEWSVFISAAALCISLLALYLTHLRGSNMTLAEPGKLFQISGLEYMRYINGFKIVINLLIVNIGNRPGILFDFHLDPADASIVEFTYSPNPWEVMPILLSPGGHWKVKISIVVKNDDKPWKSFAESKTTLDMIAFYKANSSFGWVKQRRKKVKIDLRSLKASIDTQFPKST